MTTKAETCWTCGQSIVVDWDEDGTPRNIRAARPQWETFTDGDGEVGVRPVYWGWLSTTMDAPLNARRMLTLAQAAERLGVQAGTLRVQIAKGKLKAKKVGRDWTVTPKEVERYRRDSLRA